MEVCSALDGFAIDKVWDIIQQYVTQTRANGYFERNRTEQNVNIFYNWINFTLQNRFYNDPEIQKRIEDFLPKIRNKQVSPYMAAGTLTEG